MAGLQSSAAVDTGGGPDIYEQDPAAAPDGDFEAGTLAHLVPGNRGRMLDPRRTPVTIVGVDDRVGMFELVVDAFEDRGAHWRLPVEAVEGFQFERGAERLAPLHENELRALAERFDRALELPVEPAAREQTGRALAAERARIRRELAARPALAQLDLARCTERREGSAEAAAALQALLDDAGLARLEGSFAATYVSNPNSGEAVKGHAIVLAEMGLCPYSGNIARDEAIFAGDGAKHRRRAHILLRLAFLAELMALLGSSGVELFRGTAVDRSPALRRGRSFVAATFSSAVAMAHLESAAEVTILARQRVLPSRLFMTFLETRAMNDRYLEAEAVLIGDPANPLF